MITASIAVLLICLGGALLAPTLLLFVEIVTGFVRSDRNVIESGDSISCIVLIPAHNEAQDLGATIVRLKQQLGPRDSILVVADNCTDETADIARAEGAQVLERQDSINRGKGFALEHGLTEIRGRRPDVVAFVDADCTLSEGGLARLKLTAHQLQRPALALSTMLAPPGHENRYAVATFAWRVKNQLRPSGLASFGFPCQMVGTGIVMPIVAVEAVQFASSNIVEDLELGLSLTEKGFGPYLESRAQLTSLFPVTREGEVEQRRRWEGGSLAMLLSRGLELFLKALVTGNLPLLVLSLDMLVPPLVTHAAVLLGFALLCLVFFAVTGAGTIALGLAALLLVLFGGSMITAWFKAGRDVLPVRFWLTLLPFVLKKLRIHGSGSKSAKQWVRADRRSED